MSAADELDALIEQLDQAVDHANGDSAESPIVVDTPAGVTQSADSDALDVILGSPARRTAVKRLRDSEVVQQFRKDLNKGIVRTELLTQVLSMMSVAVRAILRRI